ncbi:hypothetical protein KUTeg_001735 [Tegillarca granosa]|uniref:Uncharacterized protein n=1 Tax=Tegillarca granosa TaxID=220873 RepID=A0ABQ9FSA7_TEGGR|nr:hypothetical protein KUTeg_001735 [Tegillarca granosa]
MAFTKLCMGGSKILCTESKIIMYTGLRSLSELHIFSKLNHVHNAGSCYNINHSFKFDNCLSSRKVLILSIFRREFAHSVLKSKLITYKQCKTIKHEFCTETEKSDHTSSKNGVSNESRMKPNPNLSTADTSDVTDNDYICWPTDKLIESLTDKQKNIFNKFKRVSQLQYEMGTIVNKFSKKEIKAEAKEMQPLNEKYRHSPDNLIRYEHLMNDKRILSFQNQFNSAYLILGYSKNPFHLLCCNASEDSKIKQHLSGIKNRKNYNFNLDDVLELLLMLKMNKSWGHIVGEFYRMHPNYIRGIKMDYLPDIKAAVHTDFPDVKTNIDKKLKENGAKWENNIRKYN